MTAETLSLPLILSIGALEKDSSMEKLFYLRAHRVGNRSITVKVGQLELACDHVQWLALV
jgi:hypothetical protein